MIYRWINIEVDNNNQWLEVIELFLKAGYSIPEEFNNREYVDALFDSSLQQWLCLQDSRAEKKMNMVCHDTHGKFKDDELVVHYDDVKGYRDIDHFINEIKLAKDLGLL